MDIEKYNEESPTIFISMSGRSNEDNSSKRYIYKSYYSSHSNASELEEFVKAICPKRITYHSQPDHQDSRKFRSYLAKEYTEEGQEISMTQLQPWKNKKVSNPTREYKNCFVDRFDEKVQTKMNKREFMKQNPFMEKKRKRFVTSGARLVRDEPILSLSDDEEEEYKMCIEEEITESIGKGVYGDNNDKFIDTNKEVKLEKMEEYSKDNTRVGIYQNTFY